jgi:hypothetical protein
MLRPLIMALGLMTLAGCATTSGNSYSYDAAGDYYSGPAGADVVIDSSPSYYGGSGYGHGYGFGYGGYGGIYSPWAYGYWPVAWWPGNVQPDESAVRRERVERDRVARTALVWRPTVQAPNALLRSSSRSGLPVSDFRRPAGDDGFGQAVARRAQTGPNSRVTRAAPRSDQTSTVRFSERASATPAPMRPAPAPRSSSRKQ